MLSTRHTDQLAPFAFDLVPSSHMVQAILPGSAKQSIVGILFLDQPFRNVEHTQR